MTDNKSFLDIANENGRIRDIKEAFQEYPVKEEWHKIY